MHSICSGIEKKNKHFRAHRTHTHTAYLCIIKHIRYSVRAFRKNTSMCTLYNMQQWGISSDHHHTDGDIRVFLYVCVLCDGVFAVAIGTEIWAKQEGTL